MDGVRQASVPVRTDVSVSLSTLFDVLGDGVWISDATGTVVYLNVAARALLDLAEDADPDAATAALMRLQYPDGRPITLEERPSLRALRGESAAGLPYVLRRAPGAGDDLYLRVTFAPLQQDGELRGAIVYAADRTAQTRIERQRDDFLASIAHDLRSPLTAIRGSAQLALRWAQRDLPPEAPLLRSLSNIDAAAGRLNRMLATLLDSARLARGGLVLQRSPTDLIALVDEVVEHHRHESPRHQFVLEAPAAPLLGDWDAALLERAIENLVGNAVKYSPAGGRVTVICTDEGGAVGLTVRDQGVGISEEAIPYIFNQFYRAKIEGFGEIEGNGLGLFAVRGIVVGHGGEIDVVSTEGEGT
ncbi:MAG: sensor histidine kinase, partial [Dehalococcoidia bacterium]